MAIAWPLWIRPHLIAPVHALVTLDPRRHRRREHGGGSRRHRIAYQPAGRFWPLPWYETAIFLVLAAILAGICLWRIRRLPS